MLKEVYLLENGMDLFHYDASTIRTEDDFILTSGFFSALESFSNEVRAAHIDFFSSSEEIFLFSKFSDKPDLTLVIVCENDIQQSVARELLKRIKLIVKNSALIESRAWDRISESKEANIRDKIEKAAQSLVSVEYQVKAAQDLVEEPDPEFELDQLMIYNYYKSKVYYHYHSLELDEEEQLLTLKAIIRNLIPALKDSNIGQNFDYITIEASNSIFVMYKGGTDLTVAISKYRDNIQAIKNLPFKLQSLPEFSVFYQRFSNARLETKLRIADNTFKLEKGNMVNFHVEASILSAIDSLERLQESFKFEDWHEIVIFSAPPSSTYMKIAKSYTRDIKFVEFYR